MLPENIESEFLNWWSKVGRNEVSGESTMSIAEIAFNAGILAAQNTPASDASSVLCKNESKNTFVYKPCPAVIGGIHSWKWITGEVVKGEVCRHCGATR